MYIFGAVWLALTITACKPSITTEVGREIAINEYTRATQLYFCPEDDCEKAMNSFLQQANESIHCALFDLDLESLITTLIEKNKEIDVKVVVDDKNKENVLGLDFVKLDTSSQLSHNKFCVVDGKMLFTGSTNPTFNGVNKNNNNLLLIYSKKMAYNYDAEFNELWQGIFGGGPKNVKTKFIINNEVYEQYFCPEDNCRKHVKDEILKAKKSIYFMTFCFTDGSISTDIAFMYHNNSIDIKGVFEKNLANNKYSEYEMLEYQGVPVKKDGNKAMMHHKVFIIDNETVITGSYNPTKSGDSKNDENLLIIHSKDIASKFVEEFNKIWTTSP